VHHDEVSPYHDPRGIAADDNFLSDAHSGWGGDLSGGVWLKGGLRGSAGGLSEIGGCREHGGWGWRGTGGFHIKYRMSRHSVPKRRSRPSPAHAVM
jgi:hypothetical protein